MNKKGFVFVEMIITTVILIISLLLLYQTYNRAINGEKQRLYFDDISYVYKAELLRDVIVDSVDYNNFYKEVNNNKNGYVYLFGPESKIWQEDKKTSGENNLSLLWNAYNIKAIGYIKLSDIAAVKRCFNSENFKDTEEAETLFQVENEGKCELTKNFLAKYSKSYLETYLKAIDAHYDTYTKADGSTVKEYEGHEAVLVFLFEETKNGLPLSSIVSKNTYSYDVCIQTEANKEEYGYKTAANEKISRGKYILKGSAQCNLKCPSSLGAAGMSECMSKQCIDIQTATVNEYNRDDKTSFDMKCQYAYNLVWVYF